MNNPNASAKKLKVYACVRCLHDDIEQDFHNGAYMIEANSPSEALASYSPKFPGESVACRLHISGFANGSRFPCQFKNEANRPFRGVTFYNDRPMQFSL